MVHCADDRVRADANGDAARGDRGGWIQRHGAERGGTSQMKVIPFVVLKGRHDKELFYTSEVASEKAPLTSFNLFKAAATSGPVQTSQKEITVVIWRKLGKALDVIEA